VPDAPPDRKTKNPKTYRGRSRRKSIRRFRLYRKKHARRLFVSSACRRSWSVAVTLHGAPETPVVVSPTRSRVYARVRPETTGGRNSKTRLLVGQRARRPGHSSRFVRVRRLYFSFFPTNMCSVLNVATRKRSYGARRINDGTSSNGGGTSSLDGRTNGWMSASDLLCTVSATIICTVTKRRK